MLYCCIKNHLEISLTVQQFNSLTMKTKELRTKTNSELQKLLQDNHERMRQLRFDLASGKVKNIREIRKVKKIIAQVLTLLNK